MCEVGAGHEEVERGERAQLGRRGAERADRDVRRGDGGSTVSTTARKAAASWSPKQPSAAERSKEQLAGFFVGDADPRTAATLREMANR
ncbi:hypothetical protein BRD05_08905 [Halobacteriales archaeon QS_9_70_65]|nr:MAG: hypothetical protein BRD05_08905 [Halobacteriales archaeon QS_9_70_65]